MFDANIQQLHDNFHQVLNRVLESGCKQTTDDYYELLLAHLLGKKNKDYILLLHSPDVINWICRSVDQFNSDHPQKPQIFAFTLRLFSLIITNQIVIPTEVTITSVLDKIKSQMPNNGRLVPSIKLAYVRLLNSILNSNTYFPWIISSNAWTNCVIFCLENQTVYVVRESLEFIRDLLFKVATELKNNILCSEILKMLIVPLEETSNAYQNVVLVDSDGLERKISPIIASISSLLIKTIETSDSSTLSTFIIDILIQLNVKESLLKLTRMTTSKTFFKNIMQCMTTINIAQFVRNTTDEQPQNEFFQNIEINFECCLRKNDPKALLSIANLYLTFFKPNNQSINIKDQIFFVLMLPINNLRKTCSMGEMKDGDNPLITFGEFGKKLNRFIEENCGNTNELVFYTIQLVTSSKKLLGSERCGKVANSLISILHEREHYRDNLAFVVCVKMLAEENMTVEFAAQIVGLLERFLMKDSIDDIANGDVRTTVHLVQLLQICIEFSENLKVNCLDASQNCNHNICNCFSYASLLIMKLNSDVSWEVKDSIVEMITSIATKATIYRNCKEIILKNQQWVQIIIGLTKNDPEPFVRASALKCLSKMIILAEIWQNLDSKELLNYLFLSAQTEGEGIVRMEIISNLHQIYEHQSISTDYLNQFYSTLSFVTVNDLHWEVKIQSLIFWQFFIKEQFRQVGIVNEETNYAPNISNDLMLKLSLPERIAKLDLVLNQLQNNGVLGVLIECIRDDCDLEVVRESVKTIRIILDFLDKYEYKRNILKTDDLTTFSNENNQFSAAAVEITDEGEKTQNFESILESVLSAKDISFINDSCMDDRTREVKSIDEFYYKNFSKISVSKFFEKTINLNELIEWRSKWLDDQQNLESLINDWMCALELTDVNSMECY